MKKFEFSLSKMRDYKKQLLEREKNTLMSLMGEKNIMENRIDELGVQIMDINSSLNSCISEGTTIQQLKMLQFTKDSVNADMQQVKKQLMFLENYIERQRKIVISLSQEVAGLDKLEEQQLEEYNKLAEKENETIIEEFVSFKSLILK